MGELSQEWQYWAIVNGVPAAIGGVLFIVAPLLRRLFPRLSRPPLDAIGHFDSRFAWDIAARRDALFLGVGYLFRGLLFLHVFLATTWAEIAWITWGNVAFAAVLLVVTVVWGDLFRWRRPIAGIWLFLYIEEPIWMLTLVADARTAAPAVGDGLAFPLVVGLWIQAVIMVALTLYLFFISARPPDVVTPRILAGFTLGWAVWAASLAMAPSLAHASWGLALNVFWLAGSALVFLVWRFTRRGVQPLPTPTQEAPGPP